MALYEITIVLDANAAEAPRLIAKIPSSIREDFIATDKIEIFTNGNHVLEASMRVIDENKIA